MGGRERGREEGRKKGKGEREAKRKTRGYKVTPKCRIRIDFVLLPKYYVTLYFINQNYKQKLLAHSGPALGPDSPCELLPHP